MESKKRKRNPASDRPTLDEFHGILKHLAPHQSFTKASVHLLRTAYFAYLDQIASTLVLHDKITKEDGILATACGLNQTPEFMGWVHEAQQLLSSRQTVATAASAATGSSHPQQRSKKRVAITAEMEAEQERLLQKAKHVMENAKLELEGMVSCKPQPP